MSRKNESRKEPEILNPLYAGATPEMVARALLLGKTESEPTESESRQEPGPDSEESFQSGI